MNNTFRIYLQEFLRCSVVPCLSACETAASCAKPAKPLKNHINRIKPHINQLTSFVSHLGSATNHINHLFEEKTEVQPANNSRAAESDHGAGGNKNAYRTDKNA